MGRSIELNGAGDRIIIGGTYDDSVSGTGKHRVLYLPKTVQQYLGQSI